jgi:hypothetical protein
VNESRKLSLRCPDCASHLVVDAATGEVVSHRQVEAPAGGGKSFESLLGDLDTQKEQAEDIFSREMEAIKDSDRLLEDKFAEALRRAEEEPDDERPLRPIDLE